MPRRKDISNDLKEAIVIARQSGKGYEVISILPGFGMLRETAKKHQKPKCYTSDAVSMLGLKSCIWTGYKTYRTMPFGQAVLNWRCVAIMQNTIFGGNQKACQHKYLIPTVEQGDRGWRFRLSAICLTAEFWPKWGQAAGQRSQAEEQICSRMTEKQKNHGVAKA